MGLFDKFLHAIGFDSEDEEETKIKKSKNKEITNSKFDLSKVQNETKEKEEEIEIKVFNPETQEDIQNCLLTLKGKKEAYINLENFSDEDEVRALDFISGALFITNKSIKRVDGKLFIIKDLGE